MSPIREWFKVLGYGVIALLVILAMWFGIDLWHTVTAALDREDDIQLVSVQPARALRDAQARRIKGPDTIVIRVPTGGDEGLERLRERHGVAGGLPTPSLTPDSEPQGSPATGPAFLLDLQDAVFRDSCGNEDVFEVGCWLFPDGTGRATIARRERTTKEKVAEKVADAAGVVKDVFWGKSAVELGGGLDPFDPEQWRAFASYSPPLKLAHTRVRVGPEVRPNDEGDVEVGLFLDAVIRFEW